MKLLLTGASGFIGRNLLLKIPKEWDVIATYHESKDFTHFVTEKALNNVRAVQVDLRNESETRRKLRKSFDCTIHLAANTDMTLSSKNPQKDLLLNVMTLLNTVKATKTKDLIFMSSGAVYDGCKGLVSPSVRLNPSFPYAISKLICEHYVSFFKKKDLIDRYVILRFFGAYGPYEASTKIFSKLVKTFYLKKSPEFVVIGDGNNLIDAMYVEDATEGMLSVMRSDVRDVTVDFTSGKPLAINDLVGKVAKIFGQKKIKVGHKGRPVEYNNFYASGKHMETLYGFKPTTPLEVGIWKLAKWLEKKHA